jgi:hypothetical protein
MVAEGLPAQLACRVLDVSESGFYAFRSRPPSERAIRHAWLTDLIREVHVDFRGVERAPAVFGPQLREAAAQLARSPGHEDLRGEFTFGRGEAGDEDEATHPCTQAGGDRRQQDARGGMPDEDQIAGALHLDVGGDRPGGVVDRNPRDVSRLGAPSG